MERKGLSHMRNEYEGRWEIHKESGLCMLGNRIRISFELIHFLRDDIYYANMI